MQRISKRLHVPPRLLAFCKQENKVILSSLGQVLLMPEFFLNFEAFLVYVQFITCLSITTYSSISPPFHPFQLNIRNRNVLTLHLYAVSTSDTHPFLSLECYTNPMELLGAVCTQFQGISLFLLLEKVNINSRRAIECKHTYNRM